MLAKIIHWMLETGGFIKQCSYCGEYVWPWDVENRKLNTAFVKHELNFMESCPDCYDRYYDYYTEMWGQYYGYPI
jgi:hypothetical protein